jgi:hypothetical protein
MAVGLGGGVIYTHNNLGGNNDQTDMFSLSLEEDVWDNTGGDNTALFLILLWGQERARMPGGDSDCTPWLLLVWWGGRMGITGQVGTATDPAQLFPSLGGFMVLVICEEPVSALKN